MKKFLTKLKGIVPSKRKIIQLYSALLFNANIKGFVNGKIYQGPAKNMCVPGLNCYSCPGASGACPLGSLQNALNGAKKSTIYYVCGIILLYGILLGRIICGFLCPFGLIQELLYKIKTPKLKKNRFTKVLSYFKYVILVFFVVIVPVLYGLRKVPLPGFCKYICPAGTIEGAFGLLSNKVNEGELARLGPIFTWKFALAVSIIVGSVFIFRVFCRFICPLGALYGIFNKFAILGIKLEKPKCIDCGLCISKCKMDISEVGDHECINCGECISVCPTKAISWRGGHIVLPPDEIPNISDDMSDDEKSAAIENTEKRNKKLAKQRLITKIVAAVLMTSILVGTLVYFNACDKTTTDDEEFKVYSVGDTVPSVAIPIYDGNGAYTETFNPAENKGKVTVINFWGTWCKPCKDELPYFDMIASSPDFEGIVDVIAVHTVDDLDQSAAYIDEKYPDTKIKFASDWQVDYLPLDYLYSTFGGKGTWPITVIIDPNGKIYDFKATSLHYDTLWELVANAYFSTEE